MSNTKAPARRNLLSASFPTQFSKILVTRFFIVLLILPLVLSTLSGQKSPVIKLRSGNKMVNTDLESNTFNARLKNNAFNNKSYVIIQFNHLPDASLMAQLNQAGVELFQYIPDNAYWVRMPQTVTGIRLKELSVRGIYEPQPEDKLSLNLYQKWAEGYLKDAVNYVTVNVSCFNEDKTAIKKQLREAGAIILDPKYEDQNIFQTKISLKLLPEIAALPFVSYINTAAEKSTSLLYVVNSSHNIYYLSSTIGSGRGLTGSNMYVGMGDEGNPSSHIDLVDRIINRNPNVYAQHSTNVAGVLAGGGIKYEAYKGVTTKTKVISEYFEKMITGTPTYFKDFGMTVTNNSYYTGDDGCPGDGQYNELSMYIDSQLRANDQLIHVFAAGNDGLLTCSPYPQKFATIKSGWQCAKNTLDVALGVGNLQESIYPSSRGPLSDGRLKPEITAAGNYVATTFLNNNYNRGYGTSIASPAVAGVTVLLTERYKQLHGNTNPRGALLKALLCNSADDIENPGPDFTTGFGWMNAKKAVEDMEAGQYFIGNIGNGQTITQTINVPANTAKLKVMLYWNDAPANPAASTYLVNDLDLVVKNGGTDYLPWVLNPSPGNVSNNATRGADHLNNIEQVTIDNPSTGSCTVQLNGFAVPQGPQEYILTYEFIQSGLQLEYPNGGEKMLTDSVETVFWNASDGGINPFTLEYSGDSGVTWTVINNNIPAASSKYDWNYSGLTPTNKAMMRLSRNGTSLTDQTDTTFTVLKIPTAVTPTILCDGFVRLTWGAVAGASDYEIFKKAGDEMVSIGTTTNTSFDIDNLSASQTYWFAVRGRINGSPGRRSVAVFVTPTSGVCTASNFDNDLKLSAIVNPSTGRKFTSTELSPAQSITVAVKNLDNAVSSNNYTVSYRINGGAVVTETPGVAINSLQTINYTFTTPTNFSAEGAYTIEAWVKQAGDARTGNDTTFKVVHQLFNNPVALPFTEDFETATDSSYSANTTGLAGIDRCDFTGNNTNSRARTFVSSDFPHSGSRSVTIDAATNFLAYTKSNLITTVNLSNYTSTQGLRLTFYYRDHQEGTDTSNYVWIRGGDTQPWVQAYNLNQSTVKSGDYILVRNININELLTAAGQTVSSSFQIRFGQAGVTSANHTSYTADDNDLDDGYTFDDVRIVAASNDLVLQAITSPVNFNCGLTNATSLTVSVKNTTGTVYNNVPVSYRVNGGTIVTETIPTVPANGITSFTFTTTIDFSTPQTYSLDAWVKNPSDDFPLNDSITAYPVVNNFTVNSFPYYEGFENGPGYWYTLPGNSSWEWGTPAGTIINKAANGTKAWVTNLNGNYRNNELSYLYSPCFNLSGFTKPVLSFSHIFRTEDNCDCDFHWIEYSTDGVTWNKLNAAFQGTNWFDNSTYNVWQVSRTHWVVSSTDIPTTASSVRFRFVFYSDPFVGYEGVGIDDIHIFEKAPVYTGPENPKQVTKDVSGNSWINFDDASGNRIVSINPNGQNLGSTTIGVFINDTASVRNNNGHYYLDRNIVVKPTNAPVALVKLRFYFTDLESEYLIEASGCDTCTKPSSAYDLGVNKYSYGPEEDGTLADNHTDNYLFIPPDSVDIIPYDNGYYAEYNVNSFSEFWLNEGGRFKDTGVITAVINPVLDDNGFAIYPIPAKGRLYVSLKYPPAKIASMRITDVLGRVVYTEQHPSFSNGVDIAALTPGIYYIQLTEEKTKKSVTRKFIVR